MDSVFGPPSSPDRFPSAPRTTVPDTTSSPSSSPAKPPRVRRGSMLFGFDIAAPSPGRPCKTPVKPIKSKRSMFATPSPDRAAFPQQDFFDAALLPFAERHSDNKGYKQARTDSPIPSARSSSDEEMTTRPDSPDRFTISSRHSSTSSFYRDELMSPSRSSQADEGTPSTAQRRERSAPVIKRLAVTCDTARKGSEGVMTINGREFACKFLAAGDFHAVFAFTGPNERLTWGCVSGQQVTFNTDSVVIRYMNPEGAHIQSDMGRIKRQHMDDLTAYDVYTKRGLPVAEMYMRPDHCWPGVESHALTFQDTADPTSGSFSVVEKVSPITLSGLEQATRLTSLTGETAEFITFMRGLWVDFVCFLASKAKTYEKITDKPSHALFDDAKPENFGRKQDGRFCFLDQEKPTNPPAAVLFTSIRKCVMGNTALYREILNELLGSHQLRAQFGKNALGLATFKTALKTALDSRLVKGKDREGNEVMILPTPESRGIQKEAELATTAPEADTTVEDDFAVDLSIFGAL